MHRHLGADAATPEHRNSAGFGRARNAAEQSRIRYIKLHRRGNNLVALGGEQ